MAECRIYWSLKEMLAVNIPTYFVLPLLSMLECLLTAAKKNVKMFSLSPPTNANVSTLQFESQNGLFPCLLFWLFFNFPTGSRSQLLSCNSSASAVVKYEE